MNRSTVIAGPPMLSRGKSPTAFHVVFDFSSRFGDSAGYEPGKGLSSADIRSLDVQLGIASVTFHEDVSSRGLNVVSTIPEVSSLHKAFSFPFIRIQFEDTSQESIAKSQQSNEALRCRWRLANDRRLE
jgi:hypothetical protein